MENKMFKFVMTLGVCIIAFAVYAIGNKLYTSGVFSPYIEIVQRVDIDDILENKYTVRTYLKVVEDRYPTIVKSWKKEDITTCDNIIFEKEVQMMMAEESKKELVIKLKEYEECEGRLKNG
jgi:hypothetical protein